MDSASSTASRSCEDASARDALDGIPKYASLRTDDRSDDIDDVVILAPPRGSRVYDHPLFPEAPPSRSEFPGENSASSKAARASDPVDVIALPRIAARPPTSTATNRPVTPGSD